MVKDVAPVSKRVTNQRCPQLIAANVRLERLRVYDWQFWNGFHHASNYGLQQVVNVCKMQSKVLDRKLFFDPIRH